jgi:acetyl-CoA carboxylase biotin carboxyl carrier protein
MTEAEDPLKQIERAAAELVPQLTERLTQHGLGEIEVRQGDLRVRVVRAIGAVPSMTPARAASAHVGQPGERVGIVPTSPSHGAPPHHGVTSPAVGFFVYADGLGPGLSVDKGDELGHVEMLGVRHDVRAPRRGTVRNLVTETGEAVEYGQLLIEMEAE